jgi:hypothetical protein
MSLGKPHGGHGQLCAAKTCMLIRRKFEVRRLARRSKEYRACALFGAQIVSLNTLYSIASHIIAPCCVLADRLTWQSCYSTQRCVPNTCVWDVGQLVLINADAISSSSSKVVPRVRPAYCCVSIARDGRHLERGTVVQLVRPSPLRLLQSRISTALIGSVLPACLACASEMFCRRAKVDLSTTIAQITHSKANSMVDRDDD